MLRRVTELPKHALLILPYLKGDKATGYLSLSYASFLGRPITGPWRNRARPRATGRGPSLGSAPLTRATAGHILGVHTRLTVGRLLF